VWFAPNDLREQANAQTLDGARPAVLVVRLDDDRLHGDGDERAPG
jgi:hypothetical protein